MENTQIEIKSRIGKLYLVACKNGLKGIFWKKQNVPFNNGSPKVSKILFQAEKEITEYLQGLRKNFYVKLAPDGTDFQKKVWGALSKIPYGETRSYKDIAIRLNDANASRAIGRANGKNPLCIIVPCHRVVSSNGSIGGYSGGVNVKKKLLQLEKKKFSNKNELIYWDTQLNKLLQ